MARIEELIEKHRAYGRALHELEEIKVKNAEIKRKDNELFVDASFVHDEIRAKRKEQAKKLWGEMDQGRFSYGTAIETQTNPNPYYGPDEIDVRVTRAYMSVMGLKLPVASAERSRIITVEEYLADGDFHPEYYVRGLLQKFEIDPEGTKRAVCESVRVRMMKDRAGCPVEIQEIDKQLTEMGARLASLEKLTKEELPDNAIMRKIFKKKFDAKEKAPQEMEKLRTEMENLQAKKLNLEYRAAVAEKLTTPQAIAEYVDEELKFLQEFVARNWSKEVGETSVELQRKSDAIATERSELKKGEKSTWEAESKVKALKNAFEKDFNSLQELFGDKEFIEELRSFETSELSEEERKIVEIVRSEYDKYLAKTISKYEE